MMSEHVHRDFDKAAAHWDDKPQRRLIAEAVTKGIVANIPLHNTFQVLEYGCGTGLCGLQLAPQIGHLTAADTSAGMLDVLQKKSHSQGLDNVTPRLIAPNQWTLPDEAFDLVFSSMVLHHIAETETLLSHFHAALKPGGYLALADLVKEDGSFHDDPTGVAHFGFDTQALLAMLEGLGFIDLKSETVHKIKKQLGDKQQSYPIFLITGRKPD